MRTSIDVPSTPGPSPPASFDPHYAAARMAAVFVSFGRTAEQLSRSPAAATAVALETNPQKEEPCPQTPPATPVHRRRP